MFFSRDTNNNANPFPPPPPPLPSFFNHYQQHSQDLTTAGHDFFPAAISVPPALESNTCFIRQDNQMMNGNLNSDPFLINLLPARKLIKKPAADHLNKDRHRKIVTAQGLRDRRVRLSLQIARKFFDLQDALGFDKASKTLDWLFTKSKSAIDELVNIKPLISSTTADHEEAAETGGATHLKRNKPLMGSAKEKKITRRQQKQNSKFPGFARESRAKARERARERTKEKMLTRQLNESKKLLPDFVPPNQPNHSTTWNQMSSHNISMVPYFNVDTDQFSQTIAESFFIRRKLKQSQNFSTNYQQNISDSKHVSSNSPHVTENWDISNTFTQVNPSTADFQTSSKLREIYNYQIMSQD